VNLIFSSVGLSVGAVRAAGVLVKDVAKAKVDDKNPVVVIGPMMEPKS
jgi:hypothetical protein